jgi:hypothetical protein
MKRTHWRQFVGLTHRLGADPRVDDAADCLLVAFAVLDEFALPHPPVDPQWYAMANQGMWRDLRHLFDSQTTASINAVGAVTMARGGLAVSVGGGALLAPHGDQVRWLPMEALRPLRWRRFP